jgi:hypothetical protein
VRIVSRAQWHAARPRHVTPLVVDRLRGIAVHYSAAHADEQADHRRCAARVRAIQAFHMSPSPADPTKPWDDIAYNHVFCKHGYVFVGRGFGVRCAANGDVTVNSEYHAVCFLGDDARGRDDVTDPGRRALASLLAQYIRRYPWATAVVPHSALHATSCPGDELRAFIHAGRWRAWADPWPVPLPKWFWAWARWRLGRGEFARYGPADPRHRPRAAPLPIPSWAWARLRAVLGDRR